MTDYRTRIRGGVEQKLDEVTLDEDDDLRRTRLKWWIDNNWFKLYLAVFAVLLISTWFVWDRYGEFAAGIVFWADLASFPGALAAYLIHWRLYDPPGVNLDVEHPDGSIADRIAMNRDAFVEAEFVAGYPKPKRTSNGNRTYKARRYIPRGEIHEVKVEHTRDGGIYRTVQGPAIVGMHKEMPAPGELMTRRDEVLAEIYNDFEPAVRRAENIVQDVNKEIADETFRGIHIVAEGLSDNLDEPVMSALDDVASKDYRSSFVERLDWRDDVEPEDAPLEAPRAYANGHSDDAEGGEG